MSRSLLQTTKSSWRGYAEIVMAFLTAIGILFALNQFDLLPKQFGISETTSYGLAFVIGLVASVSSCMAVTGGLLVAVAAKYSETTASLTSMQRMRPHIYFNVGRVISYTLLGGAVGALGSTLTLSSEVNGLLTIAASAIMVLLGLQMLRLLPSLTRFLPTMPKAFGHFIHDFAERDVNGGAFALGAATFFLPCGFTQALQLYVLAQGSFTIGALTMLAFSLGTLPALLSLSAMSSLVTGSVQRHFFKFAGAMVIVLGVANIKYGLVLTGSSMKSEPLASAMPTTATSTTNVPVGDKQIVVMRVEGLDYIPNRFVVRQGVPVEWRIDASAAAGCGRILLAPRLGIQQLLSDRSTTTITFTPKATGEFGFNCGMGMMTPDSKFTVVPNERG